MTMLVGQWGHAFAAVLLALIAGWIAIGRPRGAPLALACALAATAAWAAVVSGAGPEAASARIGETLR
ncbi:MAG: hypothetical protein H7X93_11625, partial [Sphingomonadaceae bacterium]|nr:hypothetical protein [Sphingomonadaceae bacterium]